MLHLPTARLRSHQGIILKKLIAAALLVVVGVFAVPAAANAAGYVPTSNISVSGAATPGGTIVTGFAAGSFTPSETVSFSVTGSGLATLSAATATASITKQADASGATALNVKLPAGATGTYSVTATGQTSGNVATAAITVAPVDAAAAGGSTVADPSGALAFTGSNGSMLMIWAAAGAVMLGIALMLVLTLVRRQRANA